jgi:hypothetical protein
MNIYTKVIKNSKPQTGGISNKKRFPNIKITFLHAINPDTPLTTLAG